MAAAQQTGPTENHLKTGGEQREYSTKAKAGTIDPACADVYEQFKIRRKHKFVVYRIDAESEAVVVDIASAKKATFQEFQAALPYTDCRYAVYDYEYTTPDGRIADKLFFLSWMPHNATPYSKMAYAQGKGALRDILDGVIDVTAGSSDEVAPAFGIDVAVEEDEDGDPDDW
eukprot:CAMPEP_0118969466 /NCGR_PEP_ID=MMETSP1173-20130426/6559_1 /TAXON_ID=1034831 /ORGANISM="Rhizochromulina marina cf, Strain CCMP1243" /LENGTH=171 /DNA_ID=CAMNT_0006918711 /DNA_START=6 /DNA_END=518 /DNA_ORIENTATION=+